MNGKWHSLARAAWIFLAACVDEDTESGKTEPEGSEEADACADDAIAANLCKCNEPGLSPIADLDVTLADWSENKCSNGVRAVEARCGQDGRLLYRSTGLSVELRLFDAEGRFEAFHLATDAGGCRASTPISCGDAPLVTRVICGSGIEVGDAVRIE